MLAIVHLLGTYVANLFKSRRRIEAENLVLRHQLNIALRRRPPRFRLRGSDRALLVWMTPLAEPGRFGPSLRAECRAADRRATATAGGTMCRTRRSISSTQDRSSALHVSRHANIADSAKREHLRIPSLLMRHAADCSGVAKRPEPQAHPRFAIRWAFGRDGRHRKPTLIIPRYETWMSRSVGADVAVT